MMFRFFRKKPEPLNVVELELMWDADAMGETYDEFNARMRKRMSDKYPHLKHFFEED